MCIRDSVSQYRPLPLLQTGRFLFPCRATCAVSNRGPAPASGLRPLHNMHPRHTARCRKRHPSPPARCPPDCRFSGGYTAPKAAPPPVSYTHLDVYKRQNQHFNLYRSILCHFSTSIIFLVFTNKKTAPSEQFLTIFMISIKRDTLINCKSCTITI